MKCRIIREVTLIVRWRNMTEKHENYKRSCKTTLFNIIFIWREIFCRTDFIF